MIFLHLLKALDVYSIHLFKTHFNLGIRRTYCTKLSNYCTFKHGNFSRNLFLVNKTRHPLKLSPISHSRSISYLSKEFKAIKKLLSRSGIKYADLVKIQRKTLHTSSSNHQQPPRNENDDKDKNDDNEKLSSIVAKVFLWLLTAYMLVAIMSIILPNQNQPEQVIRYVSWNEFLYQMLAKGEVEEIIVLPELDMVTVVLHPGAIIKGKRVEQNTYHINIIDPEKFEDKVREAERRLGIPTGGGVPIVFERNTDTVGKLLATIILASVLLSAFSRARALKNPLSMDKISQLGRAKFTLIDPMAGQGRGIKFSDVAGLHEVKMEVMEIVDYLKRPQHYKELGAKVPKGALLLGPPGCGKTLLAKAVATEAQVPFLTMNGSEFIEMIGGLGAARVRDLFKEGRKRAPCIIYIDEIDALGRKRSGSFSGGIDGSTGEGEQTLNQLLVEMDGMASKEGVLMLASTNRADVLDKALLRPGRFDRHILIDFPTLDERVEIFDYHLKSITLDLPPQSFSKRLAYLTPGFSGADIANVVNEAALHAARHLKPKVVQADLEYAVERVVGGTEKRSTSMSLEEKRTIAVHESGHALAGWLIPHADILLKVTIVPRTNLALGFAQYSPSDKKLYSTEELLAKIRMALGGRAAEAIIFNRLTTGAENDLKKVTNMAYAMVRTYGMNNSIGLISFQEQEDGCRPYSKRLASTIDHEAMQIVSKAYLETDKLLRDNRAKLDLIARELLKRETLSYMDIEKLIGPPPHGKRRFIDKADFEFSLNSIAPQEEESNITEKPKQAKEEQQ